MKTIIISLLLVAINYSSFSQDTTVVFTKYLSDSTSAIPITSATEWKRLLPPPIDSVKAQMCKERGHAGSDVILKTLVYCGSYVEDIDSNSVIVYPSCNTISYICQRCGEKVTEREKERRIEIWRKSSP